MFFHPRCISKEEFYVDEKIKMDLWSNFVASSFGTEFIAGGVGGSIGVLAGHPLDTVRIQQQHATHGSAFGIARRIIAKEGPLSLFRGMLAPLASVSFQNAITFQTYAILSRLFNMNATSSIEPPSYGVVVAAGIGAGVVQSMVICPVELVKIRLQLQKESHQHGPLNVARNIISTQGYWGLFRGLGITVLRDAPSHGVYFLAYESTKEFLQPGCRARNNESLGTMVLAGGLAGSASWVACYPTDVIKTRIQAENKCSSISECLRRSVEREGYQMLWRGLGATMTRAFIVNGAVFTTYEMALKCICSKDDNSVQKTTTT